MTSHKAMHETTEATGVRRWFMTAYEQRRRFATGMAGVLAVAVGYHVMFGQNGLTAFQKKKQDAAALTQQMQMLSEENETLRGHVERLQNDPAAIEHEAREELHYTRAGEVIVTLPVERVARVSH